MKILEGSLNAVCLIIVLQIFAGMYLIIWDRTLIGEIYFKVLCTLCITAFALFAIYINTDKYINKGKNGKN